MLTQEKYLKQKREAIDLLVDKIVNQEVKKYIYDEGSYISSTRKYIWLVFEDDRRKCFAYGKKRLSEVELKRLLLKKYGLQED